LIFGYTSVRRSFLETLVHETFIPKKDLWSKIVRQSISISEENRWLDNIENKPSITRRMSLSSRLKMSTDV
jgi:hypothetical protein